MNYASVSRTLSILMLAVAISAFLPCIVALALSETQQAFAFAATGFGIGTGALSILILARRSQRPARVQDGLAVLILWWFLAPLATALPFIIGVDNTSVLTAVHEAASNLTTTGHSVIAVEDNEWPMSLVVWRGVLHIWGALAALSAAVCVLAGLNPGGPGIHRTPIFAVSRDNFFSGVPRVVRWLAVMLFIAIGAVTLALMLSGLTATRALAEAVSVITTGQVFPEPLADSNRPPAASIVMGIGLAFGALGLALIVPLRDRAFRRAFADPETLLFGSLVMAFAVAAILIGLSFPAALGWSIEALATSGVDLAGGQGEKIPIAIAVLPALIGGSALSAAGGVKLARLIVLTRRAISEFRQLGFRRSVLSFDFRGRTFDERNVYAVWIYLIGYVLAVFAVLTGLTFTGVDLLDATQLATGAISNAGYLTRPLVAELSQSGEAWMVFALILGRLEVLALLPAFSPQFWRG
jgi:trk system potassium uptake protein